MSNEQKKKTVYTLTLDPSLVKEGESLENFFFRKQIEELQTKLKPEVFRTKRNILKFKGTK